MSWLGRVATAYMALAAVEFMWVFFAVLRFERSQRRRVIILWPPGSPQMGIFSAVDQRPGIIPGRHPRTCRLGSGICLSTARTIRLENSHHVAFALLLPTNSTHV
jgi:hypothetical protein